DGKTAHLWVAESNGAMTRITSGPQHEGSPNWSPDGQSVTYFGRNEQTLDLYRRALHTDAKPELLYRSTANKYPTDFSSDGRYVLFHQEGAGTRLDIWGYSLREGRAAPILDTTYTEG